MSPFKLCEPSPEGHRAASLAWYERIKPTLIDQWPKEILNLSMRTSFVRIDPESVMPLFDGIGHDMEMARWLAERMDEIMGWGQHMIRLNSRSPKDSCWPRSAPITCSGKEAVLMLFSSERVLDDLIEFKYLPEQPCFICLREYEPSIRPVHEYRCFVKGGELIAVSHYDYVNAIPPGDITQDAIASIRADIDGWFAEFLQPVLHVPDVVFDLSLAIRDEPRLIELNPYGLSDPCWFKSYAAVENASVPVAFTAPTGQAA